MKAERRHELQENSLVRGVRNFPEFWKTYGQKVMLGIILVLLAIVLIRLWVNSRADARREVSEKLSAARSELETLRQARETPILPDFRTRFQELPINEEEVAKKRKETFEKVDGFVATVLKDSSDPAQQAEAKVIRADLNYHFGLLATLGDLPGAAQKPTLKLPSTAKDYFDKAAQNYTEVISQEASLPAGTVVAARLGLAAVHENRAEYPKARELYEAVSKSNDELGKATATQRLNALASVRMDQLIGKPLGDGPRRPLLPPPTTPASVPSTGSATAPTSAPATTQHAVDVVPSTGPAAATTQPAPTQPTTTQPTTTQPASTQPASTQPEIKPGSLLLPPEFGTKP